MKQVYTLLLVALLPLLAGAQQQTEWDIAMRYLETQRNAWGLTETDIADMAVNAQTRSKHNGVTHIYLLQRHDGIEVYNAVANINLANGEVVFAGNRLISDLASRVNTTSPVLTPAQAVEKALLHLGLSLSADLAVVERKDAHHVTFAKADVSHADIPVALRYQPLTDGSVRLAWDMAIDAVNGSDYWSLRVDAETGEVIDQVSWTTHCSFVTGHADNCAHRAAVEQAELISVTEAAQMVNEPNSYNVFVLPVESPAHGDRSIVVNPADPDASPYGWHDTNGQPGPEYTITRGNNVHAFEARDSNTSSKNNEPDGGTDLIFDYPLNENDEPDQFVDAATVNLFYTINMLHDIAWHYGFDEESGNFQQTNYDGIGQDDDFVRGLAQFGANGTTNINNADFSTPPDGGNGRMRMFLWDRSQSGLWST